MKTKKIAVIISGIFMIISAPAAAVCAVFVFMSRLGAPGSSTVLSFISCGFIFLWAVLNLCSGFSAVFGRKKNRQLKKCFALGIISVILFIIQSLLSAANGIAIIHLLILALCGFVIPCFQIFACRAKIQLKA